jgi:FkbM family methyltransferase
MERGDIYTYGNGLRVYRDLLHRSQIVRYTEPGNPNLHEPVEEEWICRLLDQSPQESLTFADVGAGIGYYSMLAKHRRPNARVFAVEPLLRYVEACRRHFVLNGLAPSDISLIPKAVAVTAGTVRFVERGYGSHIETASSAVPRRAVDAPVRNIQAMSLADLVDHAGGAIDLMKMDIQGEEVRVLRSAEATLATGCIRAIVVGTHDEVGHEIVHSLLSSIGTVLCNDAHPPHQPDGLIVARFEGKPREHGLRSISPTRHPLSGSNRLRIGGFSIQETS